MLLTQLLVSTGCMMANPKEQRAKNELRLIDEGIVALKAGAAAPPFIAAATDGSELVVPPDAGSDRILLFFYPADNMPNTTRELLTLGKIAQELADSNIDVYALARGTQQEHATYAEKFGITIPLLADPDGAMAVAYGCAPVDGTYLQRTFVGINADGVIAFYERGFDPSTKAKQLLEWFGAGAAEVVEPEAQDEPGQIPVTSVPVTTQ